MRPLPLLLLLAACSDTGLAVSKNKPAVTILEPVEGAVLAEGEPLTVWVRASDRETPTDQLELVYSLEDGSILAGSSTVDGDDVSLLVSGGLLQGAHTLTVLVVDADAMSEEDSVSFTVTPPPDADVDGDGHDAVALGGDDCDDADAAIHPGAEEVCDGIDQDCDGDVDEDATLGLDTWYADEDGDGFGDVSTAFDACDPPPAYVLDATDCDDGDAGIHPGADEVCDGVDQDCDGDVDEAGAIDATTLYADLDGDGFGDPATGVTACAHPSVYVDDATDCDDGDANEHPGADETCDGDDDDCDGTVDEADAVDAGTWYADSDGDGYGDPAVATISCATPAGYGADATDCDDAVASVHPGAAEVCDGVDQDCDGTADEGVKTTYYADVDGDGYGDPDATTEACSAPAGYGSDDTDCDDGDADENPAADEVCDGDDDDCDGTADESSAIDADTWYRDADGDGYGVTTATRVACTQPSGYAASSTDCDDGDDLVSPAGEETCGDAIDQDCDGADQECPLEGEIALGEADATVYGASSWMMVGAGVAAGGDLDDDGQDDVIVMGDDTNDQGDVWVWFSDITGDNSSSTADVHIEGDDAYDNFGRTYGNASSGRDLNGDGVDDLVVGAYGDDLRASAAGTTFVFYGPLAAGSYGPQADADYLWVGASANDFAGNAVALVADMSGDRYDELLIGAYGQDSGGSVAGAVYLNFGPFSGYSSSGVSLSGSDVILVGEDAADYFGWSVADVGDWDGDGLADVAIGAYSDDDGGSEAGAAYVFTGLTSGTVDASAADFKVRGEAAGDRAGWDLATGGDTNGDGYDDLVLGAYRNDDGGSDAGAVYIVTGNRSGTASASSFVQLRGVTAGDSAGYSVAGGGDVDGDGVPELLVGAWKNDDADSDAGAAYLCYGPFSGSAALSACDAALLGDDAYDYAGQSVAFTGDTDADGLTDVLIGAYGANAGSTSAGMAALFLGVAR
jgi:hypothetical protein